MAIPWAAQSINDRERMVLWSVRVTDWLCYSESHFLLIQYLTHPVVTRAIY